MRVGEAIIDLLVREYELDTVFGIPGVHNIELFRGIHHSGVRVVAPRHEQGAGFMADGWSIATGKPGVCALISGPGLTNVITPIAQAYHPECGPHCRRSVPRLHNGQAAYRRGR